MDSLRDIILEENAFIWNDFPGHKGRPGQRGGSLPKGSSAAGKKPSDKEASDYVNFITEKAGIEADYTKEDLKKLDKDLLKKLSEENLPNLSTKELYKVRERRKAMYATKEEFWLANQWLNSCVGSGGDALKKAEEIGFNPKKEIQLSKQLMGEDKILGFRNQEGKFDKDLMTTSRWSDIPGTYAKGKDTTLQTTISKENLLVHPKVLYSPEAESASSIVYSNEREYILDNTKTSFKERAAFNTYTAILDSLLSTWNSYPNHPGRPGQRGGSLPRGAVAGSTRALSDEEIISKAYYTEGDPNNDGWRAFAYRVAEAQGWTGKPKTVSDEEFSKLDKDKYEVFYRGIRDGDSISAKEAHKEFTDGKYYVSGNLYDAIGKGYYMTDSHDYAKSYAEQDKLFGTKGIVETLALPKDAKILDLRTVEGLQKASQYYDEVNKINAKIHEKYQLGAFEIADRNTKYPYTITVFEYIAAKGYVGTRNDSEVCLFNRSLAVVKKNVETTD